MNDKKSMQQVADIHGLPHEQEFNDIGYTLNKIDPSDSCWDSGLRYHTLSQDGHVRASFKDLVEAGEWVKNRTKALEYPRKRGRPPLGDRRMRRVNVVLDENTVRRGRELGSGNLSAGLRIAVMIAAEIVVPPIE